jgi:hypothetical protein
MIPPYRERDNGCMVRPGSSVPVIPVMADQASADDPDRRPRRRQARIPQELLATRRRTDSLQLNRASTYHASSEFVKESD